MQPEDDRKQFEAMTERLRSAVPEVRAACAAARERIRDTQEFLRALNAKAEPSESPGTVERRGGKDRRAAPRGDRRQP